MIETLIFVGLFVFVATAVIIRSYLLNVVYKQRFGSGPRWTSEIVEKSTLLKNYNTALDCLDAYGYPRRHVENLLTDYTVVVLADPYFFASDQNWKKIKVAGYCDLDRKIIKVSRSMGGLVHEIGHVLVYDAHKAFDYEHEMFGDINKAAKEYMDKLDAS